ncbi:MAG: hypothetical protein HYV60_20305 [Planctomycetia bacterium]|nr:hypothetical protein [Planctomycetia bacterium]
MRYQFPIGLLILSIVANVSADDPKPSERDELVATIVNAISSNKEIELIPQYSLKDGAVGRLGGPLGYIVVQVIDDQNMLVRTQRIPFLIRGIPTKGTIDGGYIAKGIEKKVLFVIAGTETYDTAIGGTNTVFVAQAVSGELLKGVMTHLEETEKMARTRDWADTSGKFSVKAELIGSENSVAKLKRQDNEKVVEVPILKLDKASQSWMRTWLRGKRDREAILAKLKESEAAVEALLSP